MIIVSYPFFERICPYKYMTFTTPTDLWGGGGYVHRERIRLGNQELQVRSQL